MGDFTEGIYRFAEQRTAAGIRYEHENWSSITGLVSKGESPADMMDVINSHKTRPGSTVLYGSSWRIAAVEHLQWSALTSTHSKSSMIRINSYPCFHTLKYESLQSSCMRIQRMSRKLDVVSEISIRCSHCAVALYPLWPEETRRHHLHAISFKFKPLHESQIYNVAYLW